MEKFASIISSYSMPRPVGRPITRGHWFVRKLLTALLRVQVVDASNWPDQGAHVLVANHVSYLDGLLLAALSPQKTSFAITAEFARHRIFCLALNLLRHLGLGDYAAVDSGAAFGLRSLFRSLRSGQPVAIFPEGEITHTGELNEIQPGAAITAIAFQVPIIPVRIHGLADSIFGRVRSGSAPTIWPQVTIEVGTPIDITDAATVEDLSVQIREALHDPRR